MSHLSWVCCSRSYRHGAVCCGDTSVALGSRSRRNTPPSVKKIKKKIFLKRHKSPDVTHPFAGSTMMTSWLTRPQARQWWRRKMRLNSAEQSMHIDTRSSGIQTGCRVPSLKSARSALAWPIRERCYTCSSWRSTPNMYNVHLNYMYNVNKLSRFSLCHDV